VSWKDAAKRWEAAYDEAIAERDALKREVDDLILDASWLEERVIQARIARAKAVPEDPRQADPRRIERLEARIPELETGIDEYHEKWTAQEKRIAKAQALMVGDLAIRLWGYIEDSSQRTLLIEWRDAVLAALKPSEEPKGE
jgi:uncharacterized coiled-coil protein SlyX